MNWKAALPQSTGIFKGRIGVVIRQALNVRLIQAEFNYSKKFFQHRLRKSNKKGFHNLLYNVRGKSTTVSSTYLRRHKREDNINILKPHVTTHFDDEREKDVRNTREIYQKNTIMSILI